MGSGSSSGFASSCKSQNQTPRGNRTRLGTRLVLLRLRSSVRLKAVSELHCIRFSGPLTGVRSNLFSGFSGFCCAGVSTNRYTLTVPTCLGKGCQRCSALDLGELWGPSGGETKETEKTRLSQLRKKRRKHTHHLWRYSFRYLAVINNATTVQMVRGWQAANYEHWQ